MDKYLFEITEEQEEERIDRFLAGFNSLSRSFIQKMKMTLHTKSIPSILMAITRIMTSRVYMQIKLTFFLFNMVRKRESGVPLREMWR